MDFGPSLKAGHETLLWVAPSLHPEERSILISEEKGQGGIWVNRPCHVLPGLRHLAHLCTRTAWHDFPLFIKPSIRTLRFNPLGLHFLWRLPCHVKVVLTKSVCFSLLICLWFQGSHWSIRKRYSSSASVLTLALFVWINMSAFPKDNSNVKYVLHHPQISKWRNK